MSRTFSIPSPHCFLEGLRHLSPFPNTPNLQCVHEDNMWYERPQGWTRITSPSIPIHVEQSGLDMIFNFASFWQRFPLPITYCSALSFHLMQNNQYEPWTTIDNFKFVHHFGRQQMQQEKNRYWRSTKSHGNDVWTMRFCIMTGEKWNTTWCTNWKDSRTTNIWESTFPK